jgi:HSP20 family molecular chaperone IbpA
MAEKTVATPVPQQSALPSPTEGTRNRERYITPPVDIYEMREGLVVLADLPGVDKADLDVRVDNNILTIRAHSSHWAPGDVGYREYELQNFFRQFELSDKVDQTRITADLKQGVLALHLPKAEEAKARRIEVRAN